MNPFRADIDRVEFYAGSKDDKRYKVEWFAARGYPRRYVVREAGQTTQVTLDEVLTEVASAT